MKYLLPTLSRIHHALRRRLARLGNTGIARLRGLTLKVSTLIVRLRFDASRHLIADSENALRKHAVARWKEGQRFAAFSLLNSQRTVVSKPQTIETLAALHRNLGQCQDAISLVKRAATHRKRVLEYKTEGEPAVQKLGQNGRVLLAGYFYSGSGAVVDYLRGFEGLSKWPATKGEFRLIKFPGGLADLYKRGESEGRLTPCDVVDFYLHLTGSAVTSAAPGKYNQREVVNRVSRNILKHDGSAAYALEGIALFEKLYDFASSDCQNISELRELLMHGLERMLDAAAGGIGANCLVIDQGVTAWRLPIAHLVPPSNFIVVHRDPRDQYVEAKFAHAKSGRKGWTVQSFADMYESRRNVVDSSIATLETECGHRFLRIAFEDFVLAHEETSNRIRSFLRLGSETPMVQYFHPDISRRNIGKYRELMDTEEARHMESLLSHYLTRQSGMSTSPG